MRGFVYITEEDLRRMAVHEGLTAAAFEAHYVIRFKRLLRLRKPKDSQCHFLRHGGCGVHRVKPVQCRLYPFWPELVENRANWEAARAMCPGIGKGELVQIGTACETAAEMRTAYPATYAGLSKKRLKPTAQASDERVTNKIAHGRKSTSPK